MTRVMCDCEDFRISNPQIEAAQTLHFIHGGVYTGAMMRYCPWCGRLLTSDEPAPPAETPPYPKPGTPEWEEAVAKAQAQIVEMWNRMDRELFGRRAGVGPAPEVGVDLGSGPDRTDGVMRVMRIEHAEGNVTFVPTKGRDMTQDTDLKCERCGHALVHHAFLFGRFQGSCFICASGTPSCPRFVPEQGLIQVRVEDPPDRGQG